MSFDTVAGVCWILPCKTIYDVGAFKQAAIFIAFEFDIFRSDQFADVVMNRLVRTTSTKL